MHQSGIHQPLQRILVFSGSGTFLDDFVNELLVLSCQLRRDGLPDHRDFRELADVGMLCKVTLIGTDDSGQSFLHGSNITGFCPHQNRFWHTTGDIVHLQFLIQRIEEGIGDRLDGINAFQICCKILIAVGDQEFREGHRIDLHKVDLTDGEGGGLRQGDTQQRTGAGNVILRCVLAEILHRVDDLRAVLHLIENDEGLFWQDLLAAGQHQILQDAVNILRGFEELLVLLVLVKVEVGGILIVASAEFLQNPGLAHLPHTL